MSQKGDLEIVKQIFAYVNKENITVEEMGVKNNEVNRKNMPTLVDNNIFYWKRTPLVLAAMNGHHQVCEYLITKQKADLEARDDDQWTALIHAAYKNHIEVIKVLLQHNANVKAKTKYGGHAAYLAARSGYLDVLKMLIEKDEDVIHLTAVDGETLLIAASKHRMVDVCKHLVEEKNANVNMKDNLGRSALEHLHHHNIIEIVKKKKQRNKAFGWLKKK